MPDIPDVAPKMDAGRPAPKPVSVDPRLALGLGLGCMVVGMMVMWKITSKRPTKPCPDCSQTRFVQVPQYQPQAAPQAPPAPPAQAPAPVFEDPSSHPQPGGAIPGTLVFSPSVTQGPGPKLASPPPGFAPPNGVVPESEGLRFA